MYQKYIIKLFSFCNKRLNKKNITIKQIKNNSISNNIPCKGKRSQTIETIYIDGTYS